MFHCYYYTKGNYYTMLCFMGFVFNMFLEVHHTARFVLLKLARYSQSITAGCTRRQ